MYILYTLPRITSPKPKRFLQEPSTTGTSMGKTTALPYQCPASWGESSRIWHGAATAPGLWLDDDSFPVRIFPLNCTSCPPFKLCLEFFGHVARHFKFDWRTQIQHVGCCERQWQANERNQLLIDPSIPDEGWPTVQQCGWSPFFFQICCAGKRSGLLWFARRLRKKPQCHERIVQALRQREARKRLPLSLSLIADAPWKYLLPNRNI